MVPSQLNSRLGFINPGLTLTHTIFGPSSSHNYVIIYAYQIALWLLWRFPDFAQCIVYYYIPLYMSIYVYEYMTYCTANKQSICKLQGSSWLQGSNRPSKHNLLYNLKCFAILEGIVPLLTITQCPFVARILSYINNNKPPIFWWFIQPMHCKFGDGLLLLLY